MTHETHSMELSMFHKSNLLSINIYVIIFILLYLRYYITLLINIIYIIFIYIFYLYFSFTLINGIMNNKRKAHIKTRLL